MVQESFTHAALCYYPTERLIEIRWTDFVSGPPMRRIVSRALDLAAEMGAQLWLSNDVGLRPVRAADQNWMKSGVLPRMAALGFRRLAGVRSADAMAQMAVDDFASALASTIAPTPVRIFPDRPAAWAWLTEKVGEEVLAH